MGEFMKNFGIFTKTVEKNLQIEYKSFVLFEFQGKEMKVKASVKPDKSKGDKLVKRRGRLYVINPRNPNRKQRQKGPAKR